MAWNLLASLLPTAIDIGTKYAFGQPKKEDYMPDTSYMDKYISSLRGRAQDQQVYQQTMRPMLRTIGRQGEQMRKQGQYAAARGGYEGTGIEAQMALSREQQLLGAYTTAGEKAAAAQLQESKRISEQAGQAIAQRGQAVAQGEKAFGQAKEQFTKDVAVSGIKGIASMATAGIAARAAETKAAAEVAKGVTGAYEGALATGLLEEGMTEAGFTEAVTAAGFTDATKYVEFLETESGATKALKEGWDAHRAEKGKFTIEQYTEAYKEGNWTSTEDFNTSLEGVAPYEPSKPKINARKYLLENYKESEILQEVNEHYGTEHTDLNQALNDKNVDFAPIRRKLEGEVSIKEQKIKGKEHSIQFTGRLNNLKQQIIEATDKDSIAADPEVDRILKDLETTGYVTADDKVTLHKYAQTLTTMLKSDEKILWANLDTGETHKVTSAKVYSQLKSEIDAMKIGEVKTMPKDTIEKTVEKTEITGEKGEKKPVEETHPEGYDESKGWSMKILGDNRVYTTPTGETIMTDLKGNLLEKSKPTKEVKTEPVEPVAPIKAAKWETTTEFKESKEYAKMKKDDINTAAALFGGEDKLDNAIQSLMEKARTEHGADYDKYSREYKELVDAIMTDDEDVWKQYAKINDLKGTTTEEIIAELGGTYTVDKPPVSVEETHPKGYDEDKGWSMKVVGDKRVYKRPDGFEFETDLEGNIIPIKETKKKAERGIHDPEKAKTVKALNEKYGAEKVEKMTIKFSDEGYEGQELLDKLTESLEGGQAMFKKKVVEPKKKGPQKYTATERIPDKRQKLLSSQANILTKRYGEDAVEKMTLKMEKEGYKGQQLFNKVRQELGKAEKKVEPEKIVKPEKKVESEKKLERKLTSFKTDMIVKALNEKYGKPLIDSMTIKLTEQGFEGEELVRELAKSLSKKKPEEKRSSEEIKKVRDKLEKGDHKVGTVLDIGGGLLKNHMGDSVKVAEPLGKIIENINTKMDSINIKLDIMDSYRSHDTQKKSYDKWLEGGKKGAFTAHPDTSFHTIGFAFDLAQTNEMKDEKVFKILREAGLIQNPGEWWHWSLEDV